MLKWKKNKSEQRGTLMVEAIAMLGLIAIVTPTLYKKSAERLQEIQDINIATQARTMAGVIETFIRNKSSMFEDYTHSTGVSIFELCKNDGCSSATEHLPNFLETGYSAAIPYGFKPQDVKFFGHPRVFVISEEGNIVFYIVYPKQMDLGKRRATRLASLIGAQGGIITKDLSNNKLIQGTGGAWELDKDMIDHIDMPSALVTENSLVLTNNEPITTKFEDTEKFLYRIPPTDLEDYFHNTMVTDLYLGGNQEDNSLYSSHSREYYSIFNVRKMTLNTRCTAQRINVGGATIDSTECDPDVADLYIGKPTGLFSQKPRTPGTSGPGTEKEYEANTGAAWIYGNLSALNDRFKLYNTQYSTTADAYERTGYDVLQFAHEDTVGTDPTGAPTSVAGNTVFMASNETDNGQVAMIEGMVRAVENFDTNESALPSKAFLVGTDSSTTSAADGRLITAYNLGNASTGGRVNINDFDSSAVTRINSRGGDVYINGGDSSVTGEITAHTYINPNSGELLAGKDGQWLFAGGMEDSAHVDIFSSGVGNRFTVGGMEADSSQIWANSSLTSLRDGAIRAYEFSGTWDNKGGFDVVSQYETGFGGDAQLGSTLANAAVIGAKYTDVLGAAYFGNKGAMEAVLDSSEPFVRDDWRLAVAGSAWVDELLFANKAWFNSTGIKELHAGFSRYNEFKETPRKAWLNAYEDGVIIRDRERAADSSGTGVGGVRPADTRFYANSSDVYIGDSKGAMAHLNDGVALFGYAKDLTSTAIPQLHNYVGADSSEAFVIGNKLAEIYTSSDVVDDDGVAVDIQKGAMLFKGHSWANDSTRTDHNYDTNTINAHASEFAVHTRRFQDSSGAIVNDAAGGVFYANSSDVLTRVVDFSVQDNKGEHVLRARPMIENLNSAEANVEVDGSFQVKGNRVINIASSEENSAGTTENPHAMFEVDPRFVRVMALDGNDSTYVSGRNGELAMLEVNPYDIAGSSTVSRDAEGVVNDSYANDPTANASVYIRRGAIELERSDGYSSKAAADEGYGYIKANRFVSNADNVGVPAARAMEGKTPYDQYMVNPAYTSVMHDIKLTTRGGARLSDILPDYVLKGVYNVSNDFLEKSKNQRIKWSAGSACGKNGISCPVNDVAWADPYVGLIPYASCPPGYRNLATIVPISFEMGQAGEVVKSTLYAKGGTRSAAYVVNRTPRQAKVLSEGGGKDFFYPTYTEVKTLQYNRMVESGSSFNPRDDLKTWTAGWFLGPSANMDSTTVQANSKMEWVDSSNVAQYYADKTGDFEVVAEPLYFQQNTFLKTALEPKEKGWEGRMGFLYDTSVYNGLGNGLGNAGIRSNNNPDGYNDGTSSSLPFDMPGNYVWNLFPVPTNTLEGHATVYCYFDRTKFKNGLWSTLVDPIDQINNPRTPDSSGLMDKNSTYEERLNDPTLKYSDPW